MAPTDRQRAWAWGGGLGVFVPVTAMLYAELWHSTNTVWNVTLVVLSIGIGVGAFFISRYLAAHVGEIGEARFDTRNREAGE